MGPAILLCPSSAVQLLGQVSPSKTTRQKLSSSPNETARPLLDVHWKGDFARRSIHSFSTNAALQRRKNDVPFAWRVASAAVGEEVSLQESITENGVVLDSAQVEQEPAPAVDGEETAQPKTQTRRTVPRRNIVVSKEELVPGATFTGKVTSIQSFGAFIDMGAFTNGLIHISRLSKAFVKRVEDVVQVGQEVNVEILDVDLQSNRISLMLKSDDPQEEEQQVSKPKGPRRSDSGRRDAVPPSLKNLKKGDTLTGVVKNIIRSGVFVTLPDGIDGFLPAGEANLRKNVTLDSHFQLGQELTVRVRSIEKGRVRLTTKQEIDVTKFNETFNKDSGGGATSPFEIAFLKNELIANYLAEKKKLQDAAEGKLVEAESEAASEQVVEEPPSKTLLETEQNDALSDVEAVHSVGGAILEEITENTVQGDVAPEDSLKEPVREIGEQPQSTGAEELSTGEVSAAAEEVVVPVKDDEQPAAVEEVAAEQVVASADDVVAPVEEVPAAEEVLEAAVETVAFAEGALAVVEEEVAAVEETAAVEEVARVEEVVAAEEVAAVVEDGVRAEEAAVEEVVAPMVDEAAEEVMAPVIEEAVEEVVAPLEDSVVPVEEEVAAVEEPAAEEVVASVAEEAAEEVVASVVEEVAAVLETAAEEVAAYIEEAGAQEEVVEEAAERVVASIQDIVTPVEEKVAPAEDIVTPVEEKVAPAEDTVTPVEEKVAPVEDTVIPVEEKVAPAEEAAPEEVVEAATEEVVASSVEEVATVVEHAVEEVVASVEKEVAAVEEPAAEEVVASMEGRPIPAEEAVASLEDTVAPVKEAPAEEAVASVEDIVASCKEASAESVLAVAEQQ